MLKIPVNSLVLAAADVATASLPWQAGLRYGLLGLPLAFAALALYVVLPHYYADQLGLSLALVGALLMSVRLLDAVVEPLLGRFSDWLYARQGHGLRVVLWVAAASALVQVLGMAGLFFPPARAQATPGALALWLVAGLLLTSVAHSQLVIAHQAWGVRLGGDAVQRSRIVAWREGLGLVGVIAASALSVAWGPAAMLAVLALTLDLGWWNLATKLNLALAAGAALPLLQWAGYAPGSQDLQASAHLSWGYALLPCALKLLAAALLYGLFIHRAEHPAPPEGMLL